MRGFVLRRLLQLVFVLFAVTFLAFSALYIIGDPLRNIVGAAADIDCDAVARGEIQDIVLGTGQTGCEVAAQAREQYNLDDPIPVQYFTWVGDMARGDFGESFVTGDEVSTLLKNRLPRTIRLIVYAQAVAFLLAIPWGVAAARRANRRFDRVTTVGSFGLIAIPNFALGVILLYFLALRWEIFPAGYENDGWFDELKSLTLPALTLGLGLAATYQRLLRTDLITTLQDDFVHMARAKGMPPRHIMYRHALRPSLFSVVTVFGINTGALIGGALVVETIFDIPGVGSAIVQAIVRDDPPVVVALVAVIAVGFVFVNFLVDLLYTWLDPRVRAA